MFCLNYSVFVAVGYFCVTRPRYPKETRSYSSHFCTFISGNDGMFAFQGLPTRSLFYIHIYMLLLFSYPFCYPYIPLFLFPSFFFCTCSSYIVSPSFYIYFLLSLFSRYLQLPPHTHGSSHGLPAMWRVGRARKLPRSRVKHRPRQWSLTATAPAHAPQYLALRLAQ